MACGQTEPGGVGDQLVGVGVGKRTVVVQQLVLGVSDCQDVRCNGYNQVRLNRDPVVRVEGIGLLSEQTTRSFTETLLLEDLRDQRLEDPGHVQGKAVCDDGAHAVFDAPAAERQVGQVQQP